MKKSDIEQYILSIRHFSLSSVDSDGQPYSRILGGMNENDLVLYIATGREDAKRKQIAFNPNVTLLFQKEGDHDFAEKYIILKGVATWLDEEETESARAFIKERVNRPSISLPQVGIYKFETKTVRVKDDNGIRDYRIDELE